MFNEQWIQDRCGKFTASEIHKLMQKGRNKDQYFGHGAMTYIRTKAAEILTMEPNNGGRLNTIAMEWGNSHEYDAVQRFVKETGHEVQYFGGSDPQFIPFTDFSGGSPDGLVNENAVLEIKCPYNSGEHIEHYLLNTADDLKSYAPEYYWQVMANMLFTGRNKAYFVSYDERFDSESLQIKILELDANLEEFDIINERINEAEKQLAVMIGLLTDLSETNTIKSTNNLQTQ